MPQFPNSIIPGSSTDLTPAVIGYYDRLSGSFQTDKLIGEVCSRISPDRHPEDNPNNNNLCEQSPKPKLIVSKIPTKPANQSISRSSNSLPKHNVNYSPISPSISASKTLQIISPNVHRMISSHQTTTETITAIPTVKSYSLSNSKNASSLLVSNKRLSDKSSSINLPTSRRLFLKTNKPTGIAIPLTKNLSKISQSIDTVGEPIVHTITDNNCKNDDNIVECKSSSCDSEKTPTNCDRNFNYDNLINNCNYDDDDDIQNVLNKTSELINNLLSGNNDSNCKSLDIHENILIEDSASNSNSINDNKILCINNEVNNNSQVEEDKMKNSKNSHKKYQVNSDTEDDDGVTCDAKNKNSNLKFTKSLDNVTTEIDAKHPTSSPKLTYSRAKLLSHQQQNQEQLTPPTQQVESTSGSDGKLNSSPSTKHRPLSAASISSSSSSSSSASSSNSFGHEHISGGGKLGGVTYLASIESLADHSENEVNHNLTMCERAAKEIVDSEKSYVDDLGQIIKG